MINKVEKPPKVALCRRCGGSGRVRRELYESGRFVWETCPQCEGSGRVTVSARMEFDIRPYKPNKE